MLKKASHHTFETELEDENFELSIDKLKMNFKNLVSRQLEGGKKVEGKIECNMMFTE